MITEKAIIRWYARSDPGRDDKKKRSLDIERDALMITEKTIIRWYAGNDPGHDDKEKGVST